MKRQVCLPPTGMQGWKMRKKGRYMKECAIALLCNVTLSPKTCCVIFWNCRFLTFYQEPIKTYLLLRSSKLVSHFLLWRSLRIWLKSSHNWDNLPLEGVSKDLNILRFWSLLSLVYKWQQRACFWEGNFKKFRVRHCFTSMLYNFWNLRFLTSKHKLFY